MKDKKLFELLLEISNNPPFAVSKDTSDEMMNIVNRAEVLGLIYQRGYSYWLTRDGQIFIDNKGNLQNVVNTPNINITAKNAHIGDNTGNYSQLVSDEEPKLSNVFTIRNVIYTIILGIITWLITQFLLLPLLSN